MPGDLFSVTAATDNPIVDVGALAVGTDERGLTDDDVKIDLDDITLRPGTHRRVSFRATPGSSVEIVVRAHKWFSLDVLDASRTPGLPSVPPRPGDGGGPAPGGPQGPAGTTTATTGSTGTVHPVGPGTPPTGGPAAGTAGPGRAEGPAAPAGAGALETTAEGIPGVSMETVGFGTLPAGDEQIDPGVVTAAVFAARRRPVGIDRLGTGFLDGGLVIDEPEPPRPPPPPDPLPMTIEVRTRGGVVLQPPTPLVVPGPLAPARLTVDGIGVNEVVDVVLSNPNDVAVRCTMCWVRVRRRIRTTVTTLDTATLLRVFDGAISGLHPTIAIRDGDIVVSFDREAIHESGGKIQPLRKALPKRLSSLTGGATFTARATKIGGLGDLIGPVVERFVEDLRSQASDLGTLNGTISRNWLAGRPA